MVWCYCGWWRNPFRTTVQKSWNDDPPCKNQTNSGSRGIILNHRSFQYPAVFPGFLRGFLERRIPGNNGDGTPRVVLRGVVSHVASEARASNPNPNRSKLQTSKQGLPEKKKTNKTSKENVASHMIVLARGKWGGVLHWHRPSKSTHPEAKSCDENASKATEETSLIRFAYLPGAGRESK